MTWAVREVVKRIKDGAIGEIVAIEETYLRGPYVLRERKPEWNEMQYQFQNWYHFNWLSGDDTAQSLIHNMTMTSWLLDDAAPTKAWGMGGRQVCTEAKYGDVFDHQAVVYEYPKHVRVFGYCRDIPGCYGENTNTILGTKGRAFLPQNPRIEGEKPWRYQGKRPSMYDGRTSGVVRRHSIGQARQQRRVYVSRHVGWNSRANDLLHRTRGHLGTAHEVGAEFRPPALRLGR